MHLFLYVLLVSFSTCMSHYRRNYDSHDLLEREEPPNESDLVECPVCESFGNWMSSQENCSIKRGNKTYKRCEYGTYINEVCGNRLDCFRGPGDRCTEKMTFDMYGQRCAHGYYCNRALGVCTGLDYAVDSNVQWLISPNSRYPLRARRDVLNN